MTFIREIRNIVHQIKNAEHHHFISCAGSKNLIIFFTATGATPGMFNFWLAAQALSSESHILLVNGWSNTWYQDGVRGLGSNLDETIGSIKTYCSEHGIERVFCSGQSMGGYGALLFAGLLGAKAIAFGAETILDLPHSQYSRKANRDVAISYRSIPEAFGKTLDAVLIVGERDPVDVFCASQMTGFPGVQIRSMRGVGHGPAGYLRSKDRLVPFLKSVMSGAAVPEMLEFGDALSRPGFPEAYYNGWCALRDKDFPAARDLLKIAVGLHPGNDEARVLLAAAHEALRDLEMAIGQYAAAGALRRRCDAMVGLANCLRRAGAVREALEVCKKNVKSWPDSADAHYSAALCYLDRKDLSAALLHLERAVALHPKNKNFLNRLSITRSRLTKAGG